MFEADLLNLLTGLVAGNIYWDTTPDNYVPGPLCIILEENGGKAGWYVEKDSPMPDHKHQRVCVNVSGARKADVVALARTVEITIAGSAFIAEPIGAFVGNYQEQLKLHGTRQYFGFWYADP